MISVYRSSLERSVSFEPRAGRVSPRQAFLGHAKLPIAYELVSFLFHFMSYVNEGSPCRKKELNRGLSLPDLKLLSKLVYFDKRYIVNIHGH